MPIAIATLTNASMLPNHVVFVTPYVGIDGGVARHVLASAAALREHVRVTIVADEIDPLLADESGLLHAYGLTSLADGPKAAATQLSAILTALEPDLIQFHDSAEPALIDTARMVAPVVASAHGYVGCTPNTHYFSPGQECNRAHGWGCVPNMLLRGCAHTKDPRPLAGAYRRTSRRIQALHRVDATACYSRSMARHLTRNDIPRHRIVPLFGKVLERPERAPQNGPVLFVGRLVAAKGLSVLLAAIAETDLRVEVAGDGWWRSRAVSLAQQLRIENRVGFRGWLDDSELDDAFHRSSVVVVPSLWPEPFGLAGVEAMGHARPVIASNTGGIPDWLVDGETGLLVEAGDSAALTRALTLLAESPGLAADLGWAGWARAKKHFTPETHLRELATLYRQAQDHWERQTIGSSMESPPIAG